MEQKERDVQPLDKRGVTLALAVIVLLGLYETLMYSAPGLFAVPLWEGSALSIALILGFLSFLLPVIVAVLMAQHDDKGGNP